MESGSVSANSVEVEPKPKGRSLKFVIIAVVAIAVVVCAALAYWWWSTPPEPETPWFFKGAYAEYDGQTTVLTETIDLSTRLELVDFNSTHLKLLTYLKMLSGSQTIVDEQNTTWIPIEEASFGMEETVGTEGMTLERTYKDHVFIEGLGTKYCEVFEYTLADVDLGNMTMTIYVDTEVEWPLKMCFGMNLLDMDVNFDMTLKDTNIPGLT